jgi:hypothetical protein
MRRGRRCRACRWLQQKRLGGGQYLVAHLRLHFVAQRGACFRCEIAPGAGPNPGFLDHDVSAGTGQQSAMGQSFDQALGAQEGFTVGVVLGVGVPRCQADGQQQWSETAMR